MKILEENYNKEHFEPTELLLPSILKKGEVVEFVKEGVFFYSANTGNDGFLIATNKRLLHVSTAGDGNSVTEDVWYDEILSLVIRHGFRGDGDRDIFIDGKSGKFSVETISLYKLEEFERFVFSHLDMERDSKSTHSRISYTKKVDLSDVLEV